MFPVTKPQQYVSAVPLTCDVKTETQDSVTTMKVCRVCLAISVKMYHMSEHMLSVMYEQVTGLEINTEDKLPKMLCWECIARLSSANNFKNKALKSHWLLLESINAGQFITMSDIESIDRAEYQLESTLGLKYYEVNNTDLHIQRESDITSEDHDASNVELWINKYDDKFVKEEEQFTIQSELLDITEQQEEAELQVPKPIIIKKNLSDEEVSIDSVRNASEMSEDEYPAVHKDREVCEDIKQERKDLSVTPLSNWNNGLPYNKELRVVLEDLMLSIRKQNTQDSFKEVTNNCMSYVKAQSIENKKTVTQPIINKGTLTNTNNMDTDNTDTIEAATFIQNSSKNTSKTIYASTSNVKSNTEVIHYDAESSIDIFICDICKKTLQYKSSLIRHIQDHSNLYRCTYCGYKTCRKANLTIHVNSKHTKDISFHCSYCSYKVCNKSDLNKHINRIHTKDTVYNCSYCNYTAYDTSSLSKHVNRKHIKNTVYNCSHCGYKTYDKSSLSKHMNRRHTRNIVLNCSYCNYKSYRKSALNNHVNAKHTKNTVFNCSHCDYKAYIKAHLNHHVNAKHTKNVFFNCSYCDFKSSRKSTLTQHINCKHSKNTVFSCSHCDYKTYSKGNLDHHVNAKHTKNVFFYCSYCDFKSSRKSTLTQHINCKHDKKTVFYCAHCDFEAYYKINLYRHIKAKHNN